MGFSKAQEAVGMLLSGSEVQVAHLRREGGRIKLLRLDRTTLLRPLDGDASPDPAENAAVGPGESSDPLGLEREPAGEKPAVADGDVEQPESNLEILYRLLSRFPVKRCPLAVSLMEMCVFYTEVHDTEGRNGKRLKRWLLEKTRTDGAAERPVASEEHHGFLEAGDGRVLSIVHEDPLEILGVLDALKPFIGNIQVALIDTVEVALMNLVRLSGPPEASVTAVVYLGEDFSRVIFLRDGGYLAFSQPIHEGFRSPQILQTVSSRIHFEQDVAAVPDVQRIVLAGECRTVDAEAYFTEQFPEARVEYLVPGDLDTGGLEEKDAELVSTFAVPIALAWKTLCPKEERVYATNFLPRARRRQQNPFEIAWHGLVLVSLLAASVLLVGARVRQQSHEIARARLSADLMAQQVRESQEYVKMVHGLQTQVKDYERNFALIDTLSRHKVLWSAWLREAAACTFSTGHVWLTSFSTAGGGLDVKRPLGNPAPPKEVTISGRASRLDRVPVFAESIGNGSIQSMDRAEIRTAPVYDFYLKAPAPPPEGEP